MKLRLIVLVVFVATCHSAPAEPPVDIHMLMMQNLEDPRDFIADSNDVSGYMAVGWWFMIGGRADEAIAVIREGLENNPRAFQLHNLLGQIHFRRARDQAGGDLRRAGPDSLASLQEAKRAYTEGAMMGIKVRAETEAAQWTEYMEQDLLTSARMAVLIERQYGDPQTASAMGILLNGQLGGDPILERYIQ